MITLSLRHVKVSYGCKVVDTCTLLCMITYVEKIIKLLGQGMQPLRNTHVHSVYPCIIMTHVCCVQYTALDFTSCGPKVINMEF